MNLRQAFPMLQDIRAQICCGATVASFAGQFESFRYKDIYLSLVQNCIKPLSQNPLDAIQVKKAFPYEAVNASGDQYVDSDASNAS